MRQAAIVALAVVFTATFASAQPVLSDPAGDVELSGAAEGSALPALPIPEGANANDLLGLDVSESEDALELTLALTPTPGRPTGVVTTTQLAWGAERFRLLAGYAVDADGELRTSAYLQRAAGASGWELVARLAVPEADPDAGTLRAHLPKVFLVDAQGRAPGAGDALAVGPVRTDAAALGAGPLSARARDAMPDDEAPVAFALALGDVNAGDVALTASDRVRVSNGGATTFVFRAGVENAGGAEEEFALALVDVPEGWSASVRSPVRVPGGGAKEVAVLVSVPFEHVHGGFSGFDLTASSTRDPASHARMRLGVLHTPIPQPAGHHPDLFLHARDPRGELEGDHLAGVWPVGRGWMNTDPDHEDDLASATPIMRDGALEWRVPLNPGLALGLDFDLDLTGALAGSIIGHRNGDVELDASLVVSDGDEDEDEAARGGEIVIARGAPVPLSFASEEPVPFSLALVPTEQSDYVPYAPGRVLALVMTMTPGLQESVKEIPPRPELLVEGFKLSLPLLEYHDRLTGAPEAAYAVDIVPVSAVEKTGLPGSVLTYVFNVKNAGEAGAFVFDLAGNDAHEAVLVPRGEVALDAGEARNVTLAVEIPVGANDGQELEVLLFVHARDDPTRMALARTLTRATHDAASAHPDEAARLLDAQAREAQVPAPGLAFLALALAPALALARALTSPTTASRRRLRRR